MYRVLKPGGHFSVSDIVLDAELPEALRKDWEMYAGCVSGAVQRSAYLNIIEQSGFKNIQVRIEKPISLPLEVLRKYLSAEDAATFTANRSAVSSITVYAEKTAYAEKTV